MVRKDLGVTNALELNDVSICTNTGTTTELNVEDFMQTNGLGYQLVALEKADEVIAAYDAGRCDVFTTDRSGIAAQRTKLDNPDDHVVLSEIISKEPLGPVVREGDPQFADLVRWTLFAMVNAEELGVDSFNVDEMAKSNNPAIKRLLGIEDDFGSQLGVSKTWAAQIIRHVGNYGEVYEETVGPDTPLALARGSNAMWTDGGLIYAPPIR